MIIRTLSNANIDVFLLWVSLFLLNMIGIYAAAQHSMADMEKEGSLMEKEKNRLLAEDYRLLISNYNQN